MPHHRLVVRILGVVLIGVVSSAGVARAQSGRISGIVKQEGGQPLKGATVTAENEAVGQTFTATTDDKGRFNMIGLRGGEWRFIAQAPGYSPEGGRLNVRGGGQNPPIMFELKHSGVAFFGALGGITNKDLQQDLAQADSLYRQRKWDEAVAAYRSILNKAPVLTAINLQIASAYRNKKDYDAALAAYNDVLKAEPGSSEARIGMAMTALERGDAATAEGTLIEAASAPDAPREVFYAMGEIKLSENDSRAATPWFEKAAKADPYWAKPLVRLGEAAMQQGDNTGAARLFAQAVDVDPTAPEAAMAKTALASLNK